MSISKAVTSLHLTKFKFIVLDFGMSHFQAADLSTLFHSLCLVCVLMVVFCY